MSTEQDFKELATAMERSQAVIDAATDQLIATVAKFNVEHSTLLHPVVELKDGRAVLDVKLYFRGEARTGG